MIAATPSHDAEALLHLAITRAEAGRRPEAIRHLRAALAARPDFAQAHYNLGVALAEENQPADAVRSFRAALALQPRYALAHYALGNVLSAQGQRDEAIACYRQALASKPDCAEAYNNLGLALLDAGRAGEAAVVLRQGARLRPQAAEGHNNLGLALAALGRFAEAEACYERALALNPRYAEAHNNLACALQALGRHEEALASHELALWLQPGSASAHWNRSLALLQMGDYPRGWAEYEWRWRRDKAVPRRLPGPAWDGRPLEGRTLLIYMEQGLGDQIQFLRYTPLARERVGAVVVECPARLVPLFSTCPGIDRLVPEGSPLPPFDTHAVLLSLPHLLGTTLETIPAAVPYLAADRARMAAWAKALAGVESYRVGIAWQGNPRHPGDRHRSVPLARFAPLARVPGVRLISLQRGPGTEQLRELASRLPVVQLPTDSADDGAFLDTAALLKQLDLVVTVDTAVAHLAGALGVPAWVALPAVPDWRWLLERDDSPWYPTLRLFRQEELGDWPPVFEHMAAELRRRVPPAAAS
jgi:tetratricopeptide (TPR) repeat protein